MLNNPIIKKAVILTIALISLIIFINFSIQNKVLSTYVIVITIFCLYLFFEILFIEDYKKRMISRIICAVLFIFWIGSFFLSIYYFHNYEFYSSIIGYGKVKWGTTNSVLISNDSLTRYDENKHYVYIIKKDKEDVEIPQIMHDFFGEGFLIQKNDIYKNGVLNGSFFVHKKKDYTILILE